MNAPEYELEDGFLSEEEADELRCRLIDQLDWQNESDRCSATFGAPGDAMPPALAPIFDRLAQLLGFVPDTC